MKRTESVLVGLVCAVLALLFAYLCVYGSIFTSTIAEKHYTVETIVQVQDQPLFSLLGLLVACGILWLFSKVEGKIPLRAMVIFSLAWAALLGTLWVLAVRTEPRADAAEIVDAARQAMSRNYTELKRKDGYMNRHPYQLGFMAFSQLLQTIFGPKNYLALQLVNVAFLTLAYGGTLRLLWLMTKKARTVRYGALLLLLCLQPILYVTFLYGNMASIACTLWAMCFLCRLARDGGAWRLIPAGLLCGLSVMMKPNGWIPVIAMLIVTGLWFLSEKKWKLLPLLLLLAAGPLISTQTVKSIYSAASGADLSKGVPMTAYLAMGLQESNRARPAGTMNMWNRSMKTPTMTRKRRLNGQKRIFVPGWKNLRKTLPIRSSFSMKKWSLNGMKPPLRPFGSAEPALMTKKTAPILAM